MAIYCNRRGVWTDTLRTRVFLDIFDLVHTSHCGSRCRSVCLTTITHAHVITFLSVCCFLALSSSSPSPASTFSHNSTVPDCRMRAPRRRNTSTSASTAQSRRFVPDAVLPGHRRAHWWVPACEQNTLTRVFSRTLICAHAPAWLKVL